MILFKGCFQFFILRLASTGHALFLMPRWCRVSGHHLSIQGTGTEVPALCQAPPRVLEVMNPQTKISVLVGSKFLLPLKDVDILIQQDFYNLLFASHVQRCPVPTVHSAVYCKQEPRAKGHGDADTPKEGPINEAGVVGHCGLSRAPAE